MQTRWLLVCLTLLVLSVPLRAQDATPTLSPDSGIAYGSKLTGTLNNKNPRTVFSFDGTRCEVISIHLKATSGDLDPVLSIFDSSGQALLSRDDTPGSADVMVESFSIPRTDRYYVVVGRFGYDLGTTSGDFELDIERIGVAPDSGCMLRYGDSVTNTITNLEPQFYYSFRAERGDILSITMQRTSGNLDAYLQVVNSQAYVIADNDDAAGGNSFDAQISSLVIPESGTYAIVASRYGQATGTSTGSFVLTLEEASNSGLGNSAPAAFPLQSGEPIEDSITDQQSAKYYTFKALHNDVITVTMDKSTGRLDPYLVLENAGQQELAFNDDSGGTKNARIDQYLIPADGLYYIIATRADRDQGTSIGGYKLQFTNAGDAFQNVPPDVVRISYGTTLTGTIDDGTPQLLFAFWGVEDDVVTASLNRADGDLDPVLSILNSDQRPLVSNDDANQDTQNSRIERYKIPVTGVYYLLATRYSGTKGNTHTHGSFIAVLARRFD